MTTFRIALPVFALLITSCASYTVIAPSALMNGRSGGSQAIVPGDVIHLTLKTGELMKNLKVTGIGSGKIETLNDRIAPGGQWIHLTRTIMIPDIQTLEKRTKSNLADNGVLLVAENTRTHQYHFLALGQVVNYRIHSFRHFESGRISGFTDTTISFQNGKYKDVTFPQSTLAALALPSSREKKAAGVSLILLGIGLELVTFSLALQSIDGESNPETEVGLSFLGTAEIVAGSVLIRSRKKMDLEKSWRLKVIKTSTAPEPQKELP